MNRRPNFIKNFIIRFMADSRVGRL